MYNQISSNKRNTWILMFVFITLFCGLGYVFGFYYTQNKEGAIGIMGLFGIGAILYSLFSYYASAKITLAISHAKEIQKRDHFQLFTVVENLCIASGLPTPKIYIIDDTAMNAFATGRDPHHAAVAITKGLLDKLDKTELEGVMAHELSHVKNYDIRLQTIIVGLVGIIALTSDMRSIFYGGRGRKRKSSDGGKGAAIMLIIGIALAILSPIIAQIIKLAISRQREFLADASGALMTRYPEGLANALEKISKDRQPLGAANKATAHLYISNPLRGKNGMSFLNKMFSTHPDAKERIERLRGMGN